MIPQIIIPQVNAQVTAMAMTQLYVKDIIGAQSNPIVLDYSRELGFKDVKNDDISWCAIFANWVLGRCGCKSTMQLNARSFLELAEVVDKPVIGDIAILWRESPNSWKGHVGFYVGEKIINGKHFVRLLGGNQEDMVKVSDFPKEKVLGYRRPTLA